MAYEMEGRRKLGKVGVRSNRGGRRTNQRRSGGRSRVGRRVWDVLAYPSGTKGSQ